MTITQTIRRAAILVLLALAAVARTAAADQDADRLYLMSHLSFRYVANPNDLSSSPEILSNPIVGGGVENEVFWKNARLKGLQGLVRALFRKPGNGGDGNLQFVVSRVLRILDKPVLVTMVDDVTAPMNDTAMNQWDACSDKHGHAWPCASNASTQDDQREQCAQKLHTAVPGRRDATWAGTMTLGQKDFDLGNAGSVIGTFVHELVHTQDRSDRREHMFYVSKTEYSYGADGTHFWVEAMPNLAATYQEGIANAVMLTVDSHQRDYFYNWFARNDAVLVEKSLIPPGTGSGEEPCWTVLTSPSPDIWLYNQLQAAHVKELAPGNAPAGYASYRIRDLPPRFLAHNEIIFSLIFSEYARHMGLPKFLAALKANDATIFRVSTSPVAKLYNTLCTAGLDGRPLSSVTGVSETGPKPYMLPLAYADYFTSYKSQTKEQYAAMFEGMLPEAWVNLYWDDYMTEVRAAVPLTDTTPRRFDQLTDIAIALGVNSSSGD